MTWLRVQLDVAEAAVEPLENALTAVGAVAIELADAGNDPILEPAPDATPLWQSVRLAALFEPAVDETLIQLAVASVVEPALLPELRFDAIEDEDWVARLREELSPLRFGGNLWVVPPGKSCPEPDAMIVTMEPGLAFGTGTHPTTSLCMDWLADRPLAGRSVLDFGCGSGILGITSLILGAKHVAAVDIDAQALAATRENARRNGVAERLATLEPAALEASTRFDVIVANILSGTLTELAGTLRGHCHTGTAIALSGILTAQAEAVAGAYRDWARIGGPVERDGWVLLTAVVD